jgi:hypothetical protein
MFPSVRAGRRHRLRGRVNGGCWLSLVCTLLRYDPLAPSSLSGALRDLRQHPDVGRLIKRVARAILEPRRETCDHSVVARYRSASS